MNSMRALVLSLFVCGQVLAEPLSCVAQTAGTAGVRAEGFAELISNLLVTCNSGEPAPAGSPLRIRVLTVTALDGVDITSPDLATGANGTWTDAALLVDEPPPRDIQVCAAPDGVCPGTGSGNGIGVYSSRAPNLYQGKRTSANSIQFTFPWDDPGDLTSRIIRITNLRINANQIALKGLGQFRMNLTWDGPLIFDSRNLIPGVAYGSLGVSTALTFQAGGSPVRAPVGILRLIENNSLVLRRRTIRLPLGDADPRVAHLAPVPAEPQDIAGTIYQTETGFYRYPAYDPPFPAIPGRGDLSRMGLAGHGTRLLARFSGIPSGTSIWVQGRVPIQVLNSSNRSGTATLISSAGLGDEPFSPAPLDSEGFGELVSSNGEAVAVWEVVNADTTAIEELRIAVLARYPAGAATPSARVDLGPARTNASQPVPSFSIQGGTAANCAPTARVRNTIPASGGTAEIEVDTQPGCDWFFVPPDTSWIQLDSTRRFWQGKGVARAEVQANTGPPRSATARIASSPFSIPVTIHQAGAGTAMPAPSILAPLPLQAIPSQAVTLSWQAVAGATGYSILVTQGFDQVLHSAVAAPNTSTLLSVPFGFSRVWVRSCSGGYNDSQCGPYAQRDFQVVTGVVPSGPAVVVNPTAGAVLTQSTNEFRWQPVSGAAHYLVEVWAYSRLAAAVRVDAPATSTILTLRDGQYDLRVHPCAQGCNFGQGVPFTVSFAGGPSAAPSISTATITGGNRLDVAWSPVPWADLYQVQVVQAGAGPGGGALTVAARQVSTTSVQLPVPAGPASVLVAGCNGNGCGPSSSPVAIQVPGPNPSVPTIGTPMAGAITAGPTVLFTWNRIPGDNGSNTTYRLYVADLARSATAADVYTQANFAAVQMRTDGRRYDAVVVANPGLPSQAQGPPSGFQVLGRTPFAPALVSPGHGSQVRQGQVRLGWASTGWRDNSGGPFQYYVTSIGGANSFSGVASGNFVELPLSAINGQPTGYSAVIRACALPDYVAYFPCLLESPDINWGPWSNTVGGPGVTSFTVIP